MIHNHLSDYQISEAFGDTLSLIYKDKMQELHIILTPVYAHLDSLLIPRISDFERDFAHGMAKLMYTREMEAIEHIQKIRKIWRKIKNSSTEEKLNITKAKAVPITSLYDFRRKSKNVSCPFHGSDLNPSMSLRNNKFNCFTCGVKGDSIAFYQLLNGIKFKEAVEALNKLS